MTMKDTITKPEVKFWMALFVVVIGVVIWSVKLEGKVEAMEKENIAIFEKLEQLERNQVKMMVRLGIEPSSYVEPSSY